MKKVDISIQNISKIEGHADLDVKVREGKVVKVNLKFTDNKRFFSTAIKKRNIDTLPQDVSRICGTCSIAHTLACIECIEKALNVNVSKQTMLLKKLTIYGLYIRDHALHLYFFSLPDVFEKDSVLDFSGNETEYLEDSFDVKRAGNRLSTLVAGKAVHAPFPQAGGFVQVANNEELKKLIPELKKARGNVLKLLKVFYNKKINHTRKTNFVALRGDEFNFLEGKIEDSKGDKIEEKDYLEHLKKYVLPYSQAVGYKFEGDTYLVGALARLNLNKDKLNYNTKRDCKKYLDIFPSNNIFHNNLAQGIEIIHAIDESIKIIEENDFKNEEPKKIKYKDCEGVGVIEAPRGILYYHLKLNSKGEVVDDNIITPTQQNQVNMELDIKKIVQNGIDNGKDKKEIKYDIEKLIRSYDPCISCATHFLKINWI